MTHDYYYIYFKDGNRILEEKMNTSFFRNAKESLLFFINEYKDRYDYPFKLVFAGWVMHGFYGREVQKELNIKSKKSELTELYGKTMEEILCPNG